MCGQERGWREKDRRVLTVCSRPPPDGIAFLGSKRLCFVTAKFGSSSIDVPHSHKEGAAFKRPTPPPPCLQGGWYWNPPSLTAARQSGLRNRPSGVPVGGNSATFVWPKFHRPALQSSSPPSDVFWPLAWTYLSIYLAWPPPPPQRLPHLTVKIIRILPMFFCSNLMPLS